MPIHVKAVPALPYGKTPRFSLRIQSGYRAGQMLSHAGGDRGAESPVSWADRAAAEKWARDTGYTVLPADPEVDTPAKVLLVNLFESFNAFQFEDRSISGADLVDDLGQWLRKHKTNVASMQAGAEPAAQLLKSLYRACWSLHSGNDPVNGGDLVETFATWIREAQPHAASILGGDFTPKVARSPDGDTYWSEIEGWGELEDATAYFRNVPSCLLSSEPHEWVEADLATEFAGKTWSERLVAAADAVAPPERQTSPAPQIEALYQVLEIAGISRSNPRSHSAAAELKDGMPLEECAARAIRHEADAREAWVATWLDPWAARHGLTREQALSVVFDDSSFNPADPARDQVTLKDAFWSGQGSGFATYLLAELRANAAAADESDAEGPRPAG